MAAGGNDTPPRSAPPPQLLEGLLGALDDVSVLVVDRGARCSWASGPAADALRHESWDRIRSAAERRGTEGFEAALPDGTVLDVTVEPLDEDATLVVARDRTAERLLVEQLEAAVEHDRLTGLWTSARFEVALGEQLARSWRYDEPAALLVLDLDAFTELNLDHGAHAGDDVLRATAEAMRRRLRRTDRLARIAGDRFGALLTNVQRAGATAIAESVVAEVSRRTTAAGHPATVSGGLVLLGGQATAEDVLRRAADAVAAAKAAGRNCMVVDAEPDEPPPPGAPRGGP